MTGKPADLEEYLEYLKNKIEEAMVLPPYALRLPREYQDRMIAESYAATAYMREMYRRLLELDFLTRSAPVLLTKIEKCDIEKP